MMFDDEEGYDFRAAADFRLDQLRDSFPCQTCGHPEPAIIEGRFCCECPAGGGAEEFEAAWAVRKAARNA